VEINLTVMLGRELGRVWSWISGSPDGVGAMPAHEALTVGRRLPSGLGAHASLLLLTCVAVALNCLHGVADQLCPGQLSFPSIVSCPYSNSPRRGVKGFK